MSKYHVIFGTVVHGTGKGDDAERKTYEVGDTIDLSDADAKPLLAAGTIAKGAKLKDGEESAEADAAGDDARVAAADGAPDGSQDPKAAARAFKAEAAKAK